LPNFRDLTGQKFNHLVVLEQGESFINKSGRNYVMWICQCDCEDKTIFSVRADALTTGNTKSCGCSNKRSSIHNLYYTRQRVILSNMKQRCYNINDSAYGDYGARGIKICSEWLDKSKGLINFYNWSINNEYEENLTIDRINVNGNYEPNNCRWITKGEQNRNKRSNVYVTVNGETKLLIDIARQYGKKYRTVMSRYENGYRGDELINYDNR